MNNISIEIKNLNKRYNNIAVVKIPNKDIGYAINDRLMKASKK